MQHSLRDTRRWLGRADSNGRHGFSSDTDESSEDDTTDSVLGALVCSPSPAGMSTAGAALAKINALCSSPASLLATRAQEASEGSVDGVSTPDKADEVAAHRPGPLELSDDDETPQASSRPSSSGSARVAPARRREGSMLGPAVSELQREMAVLKASVRRTTDQMLSQGPRLAALEEAVPRLQVAADEVVDWVGEVHQLAEEAAAAAAAAAAASHRSETDQPTDSNEARQQTEQQLESLQTLCLQQADELQSCRAQIAFLQSQRCEMAGEIERLQERLDAGSASAQATLEAKLDDRLQAAVALAATEAETRLWQRLEAAAGGRELPADKSDVDGSSGQEQGAETLKSLEALASRVAALEDRQKQSGRPAAQAQAEDRKGHLAALQDSMGRQESIKSTVCSLDRPPVARRLARAGQAAAPPASSSPPSALVKAISFDKWGVSGLMPPSQPGSRAASKTPSRNVSFQSLDEASAVTFSPDVGDALEPMGAPGVDILILEEPAAAPSSSGPPSVTKSVTGGAGSALLDLSGEGRRLAPLQTSSRPSMDRSMSAPDMSDDGVPTPRAYRRLKAARRKNRPRPLLISEPQEDVALGGWPSPHSAASPREVQQRAGPGSAWMLQTAGGEVGYHEFSATGLALLLAASAVYMLWVGLCMRSSAPLLLR